MESNIYWNGKGSHQPAADRLAEAIPTIGFTGNSYLDCYIGMARLYYDLYNNGGGNIIDGCHTDAVTKVKRVIREFSVDKFLCDDEYAENMMDKAVVIGSTHDDEYCKYPVKFRDDTKECWVGAPEAGPANAQIVTFGDPLERDTYLAYRCSGYNRWVSIEDPTEKYIKGQVAHALKMLYDYNENSPDFVKKVERITEQLFNDPENAVTDTLDELEHIIGKFVEREEKQ